MSRGASAMEAGLDAMLHQPVRTQIVAYLVGRGEATFTDLKRVLQVSDGNLESHLKKLIAADYIVARKDGRGGRPQTLYALTKTGRVALRGYTRRLQGLLGLGQAATDGAIQPDPETAPG